MLSELDVLIDVCRRLDSTGIDYMLTGSMAMSYYAVPRMTRDIDLVIALSQDKVATLVPFARLPPPMIDTPPDLQKEFRRRLMARPPEERLQMAVSMHQSARTLALASLPPGATPAETRRFLLHRFYPELVR